MVRIGYVYIQYICTTKSGGGGYTLQLPSYVGWRRGFPYISRVNRAVGETAGLGIGELGIGEARVLYST